MIYLWNLHLMECFLLASRYSCGQASVFVDRGNHSSLYSSNNKIEPLLGRMHTLQKQKTKSIYNTMQYNKIFIQYHCLDFVSSMQRNRSASHAILVSSTIFALSSMILFWISFNTELMFFLSSTISSLCLCFNASISNSKERIFASGLPIVLKSLNDSNNNPLK